MHPRPSPPKRARTICHYRARRSFWSARPFRRTKVNFNLKPEAELTDLVGFIKAISCRPIILPQNIRQSKVTVIAPETVTASEAYRIFLSSLESMGLTVCSRTAKC